MINEKQFLELCKVCNYVLNMPDSSIERVAIPWLHVIREHPIVLEKYEFLFSSKKSLALILNGIKKYFLRQAVWYRQIYRSINFDGNLWFGSDELPNKVDFLFISHLLNPNQFGNKEDFYFGNMPEELISKNRTVLVASISHFSNHFSFFKNKFVETKVPRLFFSGSLDFANEMEIRKRSKKESKTLIGHSKKENRILHKKVLAEASKEVLSGETQGTLRLAIQLQKLVRQLQPKTIIVPYEGHAFERIVFSSARAIDSKIKCVSYQHTGVFRLSNAIKQTLEAKYNPDIILTSGIDGKRELEKSENLKDIPILIVGSSRGIIEDSKKNQIKLFGNSCLVLPEGFNSECELLFNFSLNCARIRPDIIFIWRLHPSITFEKLIKWGPQFTDLPKNIVLSSDTLENDIASCSWVLYRGTTAIYKAISGGLRPIYFSPYDEMTIDPLYKMNYWKVIVKDPSEFLDYIDNDIENKFIEKKHNLPMAQETCKNQFTKIDIDVLNNLVDL